MQPPILILPGYGDSDAEHWQTRWENQHSNIRRVMQASWDYPQCSDWVTTLEAAVAKSGSNTLLVAHSLGCLLVAHWAAMSQHTIQAALLVAPPDPAAPAFPADIRGFEHPPRGTLPFPSVLVASSDDPYCAPAQSAQFAKNWGSELVNIGAAGHINTASGLGDWPAGFALLQKMQAA